MQRPFRGPAAGRRRRGKRSAVKLPASPLRSLPREVWALGAVSLLTDAASDMIYPLLPQLLTAVGGGALALGVVDFMLMRRFARPDQPASREETPAPVVTY